MKTLKLPVYLDNMATTPVDPRVVREMTACLDITGNFGNPSSTTHSYGWKAKEAIERARQHVANAINADDVEIIFTSGATESNNIAILGGADFYSRKGKHIITSKTEHKAVLDPCKYLESKGFEITYLTPDKNGIISSSNLAAAIRSDTILVSLMHVNNEIGVIEDISVLHEVLKDKGILFHVDAAQSVGKIEVDVRKMGVDLLSLSAHKAYGPKGVGALFVRRKPRVRLTPLVYGGGHEQGIRSGTLATHQIVGMGEAFKIAKEEMKKDQDRILKLRNKLWEGISVLEAIQLNGDAQNRVAGNLNVSFKYVDGEALLMQLRSIAVSLGSACTSASIEPSHVLRAIGLSDHLAHSAIRFSLGRFTTEEEIDFAIQHIVEGVNRLRNMSPVWDAYKRGELE